MCLLRGPMNGTRKCSPCHTTRMAGSFSHGAWNVASGTRTRRLVKRTKRKWHAPMKPPIASAASDTERRRNIAARRRSLEAVAIVTADPSVMPSVSDTFAPNFKSDRERVDDLLGPSGDSRTTAEGLARCPGTIHRPLQPWRIGTRQRSVDRLYRERADKTIVKMTRAGPSARTWG